MRFSCAYKAAVLEQASPTRSQTEVLQAISTHVMALPSKAILLAAMESAACAHLGCDPCCGMDWSGCCLTAGAKGADAVGKIDWAQLLAFLEKVLAVLLPLLP